MANDPYPAFVVFILEDCNDFPHLYHSGPPEYRP